MPNLRCHIKQLALELTFKTLQSVSKVTPDFLYFNCIKSGVTFETPCIINSTNKLVSKKS